MVPGYEKTWIIQSSFPLLYKLISEDISINMATKGSSKKQCAQKERANL